MLVTLVAMLCNGQVCLEKVVTNSDQSSISMDRQASPSGCKTARTGRGRCKATSVSSANIFRRARPDYCLSAGLHVVPAE